MKLLEFVDKYRPYGNEVFRLTDEYSQIIQYYQYKMDVLDDLLSEIKYQDDESNFLHKNDKHFVTTHYKDIKTIEDGLNIINDELEEYCKKTKKN